MQRWYFDACVVIYEVQEDPVFAAQLARWWQQHADAVSIVTSALTWFECAVVPYRLGDSGLLERFRLFLAGPSLEVIEIGTPILDLAARLRAADPALRAPDAIHAATALQAGCTDLLTNDRRFRRLPGLSVHLVADLPA